MRFAKLKLSIRSRKQTGDAVAAGCVIQATAILCPELRYRLISALKMAASICHSERLDVLPQVSQQGKTFMLTPEMQSMTVEHLPGIAELVVNNWDSELVQSFENLILSYVCFDAGVAQKLTMSRALWQNVNAGDETDCERYMFAENEAFESCTSWLGSNIVTDIDRFNHLMNNSSPVVKTAYISYLASPANNVTQNSVLIMGFDQLIEVYRKAWVMAQTTAEMTASLLGSQVPATIKLSSCLKPWTQLASHNAPVAEQRPLSNSQLSDITIHCAEPGCDEPFIFTVQQQLKHQELGFKNKPRRCSTHRKNRGMCNNFARTGDCSFGSECRFKHEEDNDTPAFSAMGSHAGELKPGSVNILCTNFQKGTCLQGRDCFMQHTVSDVVPEEGFTGLKKRVHF